MALFLNQMSVPRTFARAQAERRAAHADEVLDAIVTAVDKRPREDAPAATAAAILDVLPFDEFARILLAGPIVNVEAMASVSRRLAAQVAGATRIPGFWRQVVQRCWPGVTRLPADMTGARAPRGASDNETWHMLFLRIFDVVFDVIPSLHSQSGDLVEGIPPQNPTAELQDKLQRGVIVTCRDVVDLPMVWATREYVRRDYSHWQFVAAASWPMEAAGPILRLMLPPPRLDESIAIVRKLGVVTTMNLGGDTMRFQNIPAGGQRVTANVTMHATPLVPNKNGKPFLEYATLFKAVLDTTSIVVPSNIVHGYLDLKFLIRSTLRGTFTMHLNRLDDAVIDQMFANAITSTYAWSYTRPEE